MDSWEDEPRWDSDIGGIQSSGLPLMWPLFSSRSQWGYPEREKKTFVWKKLNLH